MYKAVDAKKMDISPSQQHFVHLNTTDLLVKNKAHSKKVEARIKKGGPAIVSPPPPKKSAPPSPAVGRNKAAGGGPAGWGGGQSGTRGRGRGG